MRKSSPWDAQELLCVSGASFVSGAHRRPGHIALGPSDAAAQEFCDQTAAIRLPEAVVALLPAFMRGLLKCKMRRGWSEPLCWKCPQNWLCHAGLGLLQGVVSTPRAMETVIKLCGDLWCVALAGPMRPGPSLVPEGGQVELRSESVQPGGQKNFLEARHLEIRSTLRLVGFP